MYDYTGPHDYFNEAYVNEWASVANSKRPFRPELFEAIVSELAVLHASKVLDVGSGPGFLAERVLAGCDVASYHLFDFSPHMLELSRARLRDFGDRAVFHQGSFLDDGWWRSLPAPYDALVSMQAIHEVREGARIPKLYGELRLLLEEGGIILIADEVNDGDQQEEHLLSLSEHESALLKAGFEGFRRVHSAGDLVLFAARCGSHGTRTEWLA
ncbi:MAG: class I SAM-dependent methyltransferase [Acidobacteriota bacterium]